MRVCVCVCVCLYSIIYYKQICMMFLDHPILSRRKERTNVLVCVTFIMKKHTFILEKSLGFLLVDKKRCSFLLLFLFKKYS